MAKAPREAILNVTALYNALVKGRKTKYGKSKDNTVGVKPKQPTRPPTPQAAPSALPRPAAKINTNTPALRGNLVRRDTSAVRGAGSSPSVVTGIRPGALQKPGTPQAAKAAPHPKAPTKQAPAKSPTPAARSLVSSPVPTPRPSMISKETPVEREQRKKRKPFEGKRAVRRGEDI